MRSESLRYKLFQGPSAARLHVVPWREFKVVFSWHRAAEILQRYVSAFPKKAFLSHSSFSLLPTTPTLLLSGRSYFILPTCRASSADWDLGLGGRTLALQSPCPDLFMEGGAAPRMLTQQAAHRGDSAAEIERGVIRKVIVCCCGCVSWGHLTNTRILLLCRVFTLP